jgi:hypothetical protein
MTHPNEAPSRHQAALVHVFNAVGVIAGLLIVLAIVWITADALPSELTGH